MNYDFWNTFVSGRPLRHSPLGNLAQRAKFPPSPGLTLPPWYPSQSPFLCNSVQCSPWQERFRTCSSSPIKKNYNEYKKYIYIRNYFLAMAGGSAPCISQKIMGGTQKGHTSFSTSSTAALQYQSGSKLVRLTTAVLWVTSHMAAVSCYSRKSSISGRQKIQKNNFCCNSL